MCGIADIELCTFGVRFQANFPERLLNRPDSCGQLRNREFGR